MKRPYITVEEMRSHPEWVEVPPPPGRGGTRFEGSTEPEVAFRLLQPHQRVLECGPLFGMFTRMMQERGFKDVHALDFLDALVYPDRSALTFGVVDFMHDRFPYPDDHFDGVTAWGVIEHMENPLHFLREVHRTLKPGGLFLLSLPNVLHLVSRLQFLFTGVLPRWHAANNHIFILPPGVLEKTVLRYFTLEETLYTKPGNVEPNPAAKRWGALYGLADSVLKRLPANKWNGNYVLYVLRARPAAEVA
jgi:2-polyprenyl-3-methyl-5-hydroxy-6-metoxy-1,4-benzoquinol methylase